ncbi:MAG: hypothetical protein H0V01_10025 [Bacteroidetes bacterium]|nr:hypothetical protein [Bacteroidota bacterium]HET6243868.1 hypothetical protein [Bacteroidia bacterium]
MAQRKKIFSWEILLARRIGVALAWDSIGVNVEAVKTTAIKAAEMIAIV